MIWLRLNGGFSNGTRFTVSFSDFLAEGGTEVRPPAPIFSNLKVQKKEEMVVERRRIGIKKRGVKEEARLESA